MDRMKLLKLQIVIGIITSCIGIVTIMYGVNFYNHPSRGNIVTCIALLFCCMLSINFLYFLRNFYILRYFIILSYEFKKIN